MKIQNLAQQYDMSFVSKYNTTYFDNVYFDKNTKATYSIKNDTLKTHIYIDTELSVNFRYEEKIDDKFYIIELKRVFYHEYLLLNICVTLLEDNKYSTYEVTITDDELFKEIKRKTVKKVLAYSLDIFNVKKYMIIKMLIDGITYNSHLSIREQNFISKTYIG